MVSDKICDGFEGTERERESVQKFSRSTINKKRYGVSHQSRSEQI